MRLDENQLGELLKAPLALLAITDPETLDQVNNLLPYSIGFEIECDMIDKDNNEAFKNIPYIMDVHNTIGEQRYRIPNGIRGIICLYFICQQLPIYSLLNPASGIHYHVDCKTDDTHKDLRLSYILTHEKFILKELSTWGYKGTYNKKDIGGKGNWLNRCSGYETLEFRIGEMTFDYDLILKRMLHLSKLVKFLKDNLSVEVKKPVFEPIQANVVIDYQRVILSEFKSEEARRMMRLNRLLAEQMDKASKLSKKPEEESINYRRRSHNI